MPLSSLNGPSGPTRAARYEAARIDDDDGGAESGAGDLSLSNLHLDADADADVDDSAEADGIAAQQMYQSLTNSAQGSMYSQQQQQQPAQQQIQQSSQKQHPYAQQYPQPHQSNPPIASSSKPASASIPEPYATPSSTFAPSPRNPSNHRFSPSQSSLARFNHSPSVGDGKDWQGRVKGSFGASRDSLNSAASGGPAAYHSAEEDLGDRQQTLQASFLVSSPEQTPKKKRQSKGKSREVPPLPDITPRRTSLGKTGKSPHLSHAASFGSPTDASFFRKQVPSSPTSSLGFGSNSSMRAFTDCPPRSSSLHSPSASSSSANPFNESSTTVSIASAAAKAAAAGTAAGAVSEGGTKEASASDPAATATPSAPPLSQSKATAPAGLGIDVPGANADSVMPPAFSPTRLPALNEEALPEVSLLQRWILSIGIVNFDLEKGPELETLWPPLGISREERDNIAFSSFPDTSIFDVGDTSFSFRVREVPLHESTSSPPKIGNHYESFPRSQSPEQAHVIGDPAEWSSRKHETSENGSLVRSLLSRGQSGVERANSVSVSASSTGQGSSPVVPASKSFPSVKRIDAEQKYAESDASSRSSFESPTMDGPLSSTQEAAVSAAANTSNGMARSDSLSAPQSNSRKFSSSTSSSYIYGYTYFRQKRDPSIRRGYFQKSVVLLSHLPYVSLFGEILKRLGPLYFEHGEATLEAFSSSVSKWPNPAPGATLPLPLFGNVLWVSLPLGRQAQTSSGVEAYLPNLDSSSNKTSSGTVLRRSSVPRIDLAPAGSVEEEPILASIPSNPFVSVFKEGLADLWLIWECLLLAEPILVLGPHPQACSEAVWHLLDLCRPIPHAGDFRPFFTIHDFDFTTLATRKPPPAGTIIGCTNPFMAQACAHWPHVLRVGKAAVKLGTAGKYGSKGSGKTLGGGIAGGQGAGGGGPEHQPGFVSKRKRRVSKDRALLKKLQELVEKEESIVSANALLRRYFADLTERFLAPLNRYVSSLIPPTSSVSKSGTSDRIKSFNTEAFLASLKAHGTPLPLRSRSLPTASTVRQGLYLDFLKSPNFSFYLTERIAYYQTRNPIPEEKRSRFDVVASKGLGIGMGSAVHSRAGTPQPSQPPQPQSQSQSQSQSQLATSTSMSSASAYNNGQVSGSDP